MFDAFPLMVTVTLMCGILWVVSLAQSGDRDG